MAGLDINFLIAVPERTEAGIIGRTLREMGFYNLTRAEDGLTALDLIRSRPEAFLIIAWDLPLISGPGVIEMVRRESDSSDLACLLIMPTPDAEEIARVAKLNLDGILTRPIIAGTLAAKIKEALDKRNRQPWPETKEAKGDHLLESGQPHEALEEYAKALRTGQNRLASLYTDMADILMKQGRLDEAVAGLEEAVQADPGLARAQAALGRAYLEAGRPDEAAQALEKALAIDPLNEEIQTGIAETHLQLENLHQAEALFRKLWEQSPHDLHILNRLGITLRKQGKYEEALTYYRQALQVFDQDENLYFNLGRCYFEAGRMDQARSSIRQALALNPDFHEARELLDRINRDQTGSDPGR